MTLPKTCVDSLFREVILHRSDMHGYQNEGADFMYGIPFSALFIDLGLGKTVISLTVIARLVHEMIDAGEDKPILIIAPLKVATQTWPNEIPLWSHSAGLSHVVIRCDEKGIHKDEIKAAGQARVDAVRGFYADMTDPAAWLNSERAGAETKQKYVIMERLARTRACVHIIALENLVWLVKLFGKSWPFKAVFVDESSTMKDYSTERFRALKVVRPYIERLHLMTATPAPESYEDLFAQVFLLDGGERFSRSIKYFRDKWFTHDPYKRKWSLRPGAEDQITKLIAPICLVMKAKDYLNLKEATLLPRRLRMSKEQAHMYRKFERDFVLELPTGEEILAENAADQAQKLLQLCSGSVYQTVLEPHPTIRNEFRKRKIIHDVHDLKIEDLQSLVEELQGDNVLVAYWFKSSLDKLKKAFPKAKVMDREGKLTNEWNKGKLEMCLVHPQGSSRGLNMQKGGHHLYIFDMFYSAEYWIQLIGRLARQGQKFPVVVHLPQVYDTVDEIVVQAQMQKRDVQEDLFRRLKLLRKRAEATGKWDGEFDDVDYRDRFSDDAFADTEL